MDITKHNHLENDRKSQDILLGHTTMKVKVREIGRKDKMHPQNFETD